MLPSQHSPAPAGRAGAELGCSRLAHPAPLPAGYGCGYTGVCPSIPVLPASHRVRLGARLLLGSFEEQRGLAAPTLPSEPAPARRAATQAAPGAQACASSISLLVGLCQAGSLPSEVQPSLPHRDIYRKAIAVPKTARPSRDAAAPFENFPPLVPNSSPLWPPASLWLPA